MSFRANPEYFESFFQRTDQSKFRSSFHLRQKELDYIQEKGMSAIRKDAAFFIQTRLADAWPKNDGKQTPMKNHPVFIAQHACGCCCRSCLEKWHGIAKGHALTSFEQEYIIEVLMQWMQRELERKQDETIHSSAGNIY